MATNLFLSLWSGRLHRFLFTLHIKLSRIDELSSSGFQTNTLVLPFLIFFFYPSSLWCPCLVIFRRNVLIILIDFSFLLFICLVLFIIFLRTRRLRGVRIMYWFQTPSSKLIAMADQVKGVRHLLLWFSGSKWTSGCFRYG